MFGDVASRSCQFPNTASERVAAVLPLVEEDVLSAVHKLDTDVCEPLVLSSRELLLVCACLPSALKKRGSYSCEGVKSRSFSLSRKLAVLTKCHRQSCPLQQIVWTLFVILPISVGAPVHQR